MANYAATLVKTGLEELANRDLNKSVPDNWYFRYFTNNVTIDVDTVVGDLTECADGNYAAYELPPGSWTVTWNVDKMTASFTVDDTITFASAATIYGFYLTNATGTILFAGATYVPSKSYSAGDKSTFQDGYYSIKGV